MFNEAILDLYKLKDKYKDNSDITESVNQILKNLLVGMAAMTDIIADIVVKRQNTIKH